MSVNGDVRVDPVNIRGDISVALRGEDGLSAYEVAVKNGFSGTEEEWLESLKGEAARAEAYTNEAKEYWQNAQASAIQSGNSAVEAARYRNEAQDIRDAFAPEVADARAAIQAEKEEAEQKKLLVDDAAANAHLDREQADADAAEVRYLYNETISQKNVATDAAERARLYAQGAGGYASEAQQHSQEAEGFAQQAQAHEEQCTVLWENMKTFPDTARLYMEEAGRSATLASQEADKAHSSAVLASQEAYQAGQIRLDMLDYGETLRQNMDACESRTEGYSIQAKDYADLAGASAEMVQNKIDTSVAEAVTEQLAGKLDVNGKAVDSAHADNADEATHADSADDALHAGDADTVNGHTVETSVPPNAVFTDTTYEVMASSELEDGVSTQGRLIDAHTLATFILTVAADVVNNAPEALDTLAELAQALGNDPNFATTVMTEIGKKLDKAGGVVTGDLTVNGTFTGNVTGNVSGSSGSCTGNAATATNLSVKNLGTNYEMNYADFASNTMFYVSSFKTDAKNSPSYKWTGNDVGDYYLRKHYFGSANYCVIECISPRWDSVAYGKFWNGVWQGWEIPVLSAANAEKLGGYAIASNASVNTGPTWGGVPIIKSDGVMEVGRYIDFHSTNNDSADYSARLDANNGKISSSCNIAAPAFIGNLTGTASDNVPLAGGVMTGQLTTINRLTVKDLNKDWVNASKPSSATLVAINFADKNNTGLGYLETYDVPNSTRHGIRLALPSAATSPSYSNIGIEWDGTSFYGFAPTPATADNSTKIATTAFVKNQGYVTSAGTVANVTGTVAIGNGGTGATTAAAARQNFFGDNLASSGQYLLAITDNWVKGGYVPIGNVKSLIGLGNVNNTADANKSVSYATTSGTASALAGTAKITPEAASTVNTPSADSKLHIKMANSSVAPNNGVILEFGNVSTWAGQLYLGDNADLGMYWNGWSNGVRGSWKKIAFTTDNVASANKINGKTVAVVSSFSNGVLALTGLS